MSGLFSICNNLAAGTAGYIMSTLKLRKNLLLPHGLRPARYIRIYASIVGVAIVLLLANFEVLPLAIQSHVTLVDPVLPQAEPGPATAKLLMELNAQNPGVTLLDYVTHPYLTGRGTLVGFAGDNIQVFEYPTSELARSEAAAIFGRASRTAAKSYFHLFLKENLIVLYFGYNAAVLKATEDIVGPPIANTILLQKT